MSLEQNECNLRKYKQEEKSGIFEQKKPPQSILRISFYLLFKCLQEFSKLTIFELKERNQTYKVKTRIFYRQYTFFLISFHFKLFKNFNSILLFL
jgi:hypothetical protein